MGNIENQQIGVAVLPQLAVDIAFNGQFRRCLKLINGNDTRAQRGKTVQAFAKIPLFMSGLQIARADITVSYTHLPIPLRSQLQRLPMLICAKSTLTLTVCTPLTREWCRTPASWL